MSLTFIIFFGFIVAWTIFASINFVHLYTHRELGTLAVPSIIVLGIPLVVSVIYAMYTLVVYTKLLG